MTGPLGQKKRTQLSIRYSPAYLICTHHALVKAPATENACEFRTDQSRGLKILGDNEKKTRVMYMVYMYYMQQIDMTQI